MSEKARPAKDFNICASKQKEDWKTLSKEEGYALPVWTGGRAPNGAASNSLRSLVMDRYGAIVHTQSSELEFTQWRPLEKVTSVTLSFVRPGSLNPTSISAFFHLPGGATDAIGDLFELSTML